MPSSQLKRAERSIQTIRDQAELPPEMADALQELVDVIRAIEGRLSALEGQGNERATDAMTLPNLLQQLADESDRGVLVTAELMTPAKFMGEPPAITVGNPRTSQLSGYGKPRQPFPRRGPLS
jgi:hypothetical protein